MEKVKTQPRISKSETHDAMARCRAVLSVWTAARKPSEVCREMGLKWMTFSHWQKRAMEGMLQALEPRVNLEKGPALSPRLQRLLEKESQHMRTLSVEAAATRLSNRLQRVQESKSAEKKKEEPMSAKA